MSLYHGMPRKKRFGAVSHAPGYYIIYPAEECQRGGSATGNFYQPRYIMATRTGTEASPELDSAALCCAVAVS
jgi:hypothetical protein